MKYVALFLSLLFKRNATGLQLSAAIVAPRSSFGAKNPADILLPTLVATLFSTLLGALLVFLTAKKRRV